MSQVTEDFISMDKLARIYRKIKAKMSERTAEYEAEMETLKGDLNEIVSVIKDQMKVLGSKSLKTADGHIIISQKTRYEALDWDAFKEFVLVNNALDLVERRIAQLPMRKFLEENPGLVPRGLNAVSEMTVSVRKV